MADPTAEEKHRGEVAAAAALVEVYAAARTEVMARVGRGVRDVLLLPYWADRVIEVNEDQLKEIAGRVARALSDRVSLPRMDAYLEVSAQHRGDAWFREMTEAIEAAVARVEEAESAVQAVMDTGVTRATEDARNLAASAAEFGASEAAKADGKTTKTWHLGAGANHRASHIALNGTTVPIDSVFPNGLAYPGAPGPPAETVNCNCYLTFGGGPGA